MATVHQPRARARPLIIAHRAGNDLSKLRSALAAGVDYAEADVWLLDGRLEVRHDRPIGVLRIFQNRWPLRLGRPARLLLQDILVAAQAGRLFLDLKGSASGLADAIAGQIERASAGDRVAASGGWSHLDRLAELLPHVARFYSIGSVEQLAGLRARLERREIASVSVDWRILTKEIVSDLRKAGVEMIVAWTVEVPADARRLLAWGVDGISSDSLTLLTAIRDGQIDALGG